MSSTTNEIYMWVYWKMNVYGTYQSLTTENKTSWNTCAKKVVYIPRWLLNWMEMVGMGVGNCVITMKR